RVLEDHGRRPAGCGFPGRAGVRHRGDPLAGLAATAPGVLRLRLLRLGRGRAILAVPGAAGLTGRGGRGEHRRRMGRVGATPIEVWEGRPREHWRALWGVPVLELYGVAPSTNDIARGLAEAGAPEGAVVIADHQTAGRGRGGRPWLTPPGRAL